mgnify:FL=1
MAPMAPPTTRPRKTVQDFLALPDDVRAELIDGELYVTPSPRPRHQDAAGRIYRALLGWADTTGAGAVYVAPLDVHLPSGDVVQPDVLFVRTEHASIVSDWVRGAPDLAVEVVSPAGRMRDRIVKRDLYARNGISAYWIADPEERSIEILRLEGASYRPEAFVTGEQDLVTPALPGLCIPLTSVFR